MLSFLKINQFKLGLTPVTSTLTILKGNEFHDEGLFSEKIFGVMNTKDRREKFSYIDLNCKVIHPSAYNILLRIDRKIEKFISTENSYILTSDGLLQESPDGITGINEFIKLFPLIKFRGETPVREKFIKLLRDEFKKGNLFIDTIPVIPCDFRPLTLDPETMEWTQDALNDIYQSIIKKSSQIKMLSSGPLFDLMNYAVQKAIIDHDKFIRTKIEKKRGLIRSKMLGKRVDFSGRAVITPNPKLNGDEIGVPFRMAVSLFEPFIIHIIINSGKVNKIDLSNEIKNYINLDLSSDSLLRVLKGIKDGDIIPEKLYKIIYDATELAMIDRAVIIKRDPVLHAQSYLGMKPILHTGNTLLLNTLICPSLNADFDGDQLAIYHPLTKESQDEIKTKMMNVTSGTSSSEFSSTLSKEMLVGLYSISKEINIKKIPEVYVNDEDLENIKDPYIPVKYRNIKTSAGKAIINKCFPNDYPFINVLVTKKVIQKEIENVYRIYGQNQTKKTINELKNVGFKWASIISPNMTLEDLELPKEIYALKKDLQKATPDEAQEIINKATKMVLKHLEDTGLGDLANSGASRGVGQLMQILFAKGIITDTSGNILPVISSSFSDGFSNKEYFNMSSMGRKGIIDRVINTASTGYMSRKLAFVCNSIEISQNIQDCKTEKLLAIKLNDKIIPRLTGRYISINGKLELFDAKKFSSGDIIYMRSPIFCQSKKICWTCYGELIRRHKTPYIGILAAQVIGERGTQLIMRSFHNTSITLTKMNILKDLQNNIIDR